MNDIKSKKEIEALAEKHANDKHLIKGYTGTYDLETSLQLSAQIENSKDSFIAGYNAANDSGKSHTMRIIEKRLTEINQKALDSKNPEWADLYYAISGELTELLIEIKIKIV